MTACGNAQATTRAKVEMAVVSTFGLSEDIVKKTLSLHLKKRMKRKCRHAYADRFKINPNAGIDVIELAQANAQRWKRWVI